MKSKSVINASEGKAVVNLQAENGETYEFSYSITGLKFINLMATVAKIEKKKTKDESKQAMSFLALFDSVKSLVGEETYEEILEFGEDNDEEIGFEQFLSMVFRFTQDEDLPKE